MVPCGNGDAQHSLLSLVESLQDKLTNQKEADERCAALNKIGEHVETRGDQYTEQEGHFLSEFLAAKLSSDSIQVIPAVLECCVKLLSHAVQTFALKDLVRVLKAALDELYVQSFTQSTRLMAYRLCILGISSLSDEGAVFAKDQDEAIRLLGGAEHSILQVIRMIDGEKDPRNLLHTFHLVQLIATWPKLQSNLYVLSEELFEVFSCYFPIEFADQSDQNDERSVGVTRNDLKSALLKCFSATRLFADHAVPYLLDKLSAEVIQCKVDALEALGHCSSCYLLQQDDIKFSEYSQQMWFGMLSELTTHGNELVLKACYDFFDTLLSVVFEKSVSKERQIEFLEVVVKDTKGHFASVGTKTHKLTLQLLVKCVPFLITEPRGYFDFFFYDVLDSIVNTALESSHQLNKCLPSINALLKAVSQNMQSNLPSQTKECLNRLSFLLLETFQSVSERHYTEDRIKDCLFGLTYLASVNLDNPESFLLIWTVMTTAYWKKFLESSEICSSFLELYLNLFKSMLSICDTSQTSLAFQQLVHQEKSFENPNYQSLNLFLLVLLQFPSRILISDDYILSSLLDSVARFCFSSTKEDGISDRVVVEFTGFLECDEYGLAEVAKKFVSEKINRGSDAKDFSVVTSAIQHNILIPLISKLNCDNFAHEFRAVFERIKLPDVSEVSQILFATYCFAASDEMISEVNCIDVILSDTQRHCDLIPVLINRTEDLSLFTKYLNSLTEEEYKYSDQSQCLNFLMTCHALIRRGCLKQPITRKLLIKYMSLLTDKAHGKFSATQSSLLINGFDEKAARRLKLRTRPMFVQQLVYDMVPQLLDMDKINAQGDDEAKCNWILCLMSFLQCLPDNIKTTVTSLSNRNNPGGLMQIIRMALNIANDQSTQSNSNSDVLSSALKLLETSMQFDNVVVMKQIHSELLKLATGGNNVDVRVNSLKCLAKIGLEQNRCKEWLNGDVKRRTKRTVDRCLDDSKRVVRRAAVTTKTAWDNFGL